MKNKYEKLADWLYKKLDLEYYERVFMSIIGISMIVTIVAMWLNASDLVMSIILSLMFVHVICGAIIITLEGNAYNREKTRIQEEKALHILSSRKKKDIVT